MSALTKRHMGSGNEIVKDLVCRDFTACTSNGHNLLTKPYAIDTIVTFILNKKEQFIYLQLKRGNFNDKFGSSSPKFERFFNINIKLSQVSERYPKSKGG